MIVHADGQWIRLIWGQRQVDPSFLLNPLRPWVAGTRVGRYPPGITTAPTRRWQGIAKHCWHPFSSNDSFKMTQPSKSEDSDEKPVDPSEHPSPETAPRSSSRQVNPPDKVAPDEIFIPSDGRLIIHVTIPEAVVIHVRISKTRQSKK